MNPPRGLFWLTFQELRAKLLKIALKESIQKNNEESMKKYVGNMKKNKEKVCGVVLDFLRSVLVIFPEVEILQK